MALAARHGVDLPICQQVEAVLFGGRRPLEALQALMTRPTVAPVPGNWKPYLDKLPNDPWGRAYLYLNPGVKGEVDVFSLGADGQAGGEGKNADIGSWQ